MSKYTLRKVLFLSLVVLGAYFLTPHHIFVSRELNIRDSPEIECNRSKLFPSRELTKLRVSSQRQTHD